MKSEKIDCTLCLITDRSLARGRSTLDIVNAAVCGGVTSVQLREKIGSTRDFIEQALTIRDFLKSRDIPLIINDRLDVALAVGADGLHLGQNDMPLAVARSIVQDTMIIGISANSLEDAVAAEKGGANYLGVGPIYATDTKNDTAPVLGLNGLRKIRKNIKIPLVTIGGLNRSNAAQVIRNGADGIAVVSAIVAAENPEIASRELMNTIQQAKAG
ncbi:MAG: thiamine phosphate synthase [Desulfobacterales bacterium]